VRHLRDARVPRLYLQLRAERLRAQAPCIAPHRNVALSLLLIRRGGAALPAGWLACMPAALENKVRH
jgi:hypothetical protein